MFTSLEAVRNSNPERIAREKESRGARLRQSKAPRLPHYATTARTVPCATFLAAGFVYFFMWNHLSFKGN
jgi:hypothetical protein